MLKMRAWARIFMIWEYSWAFIVSLLHLSISSNISLGLLRGSSFAWFGFNENKSILIEKNPRSSGILSIRVNTWIRALYPLWWTVVGAVGARVSILITSAKWLTTITVRIPLIVITTFASARCIWDWPYTIFSLARRGCSIRCIAIIVIIIGRWSVVGRHARICKSISWNWIVVIARIGVMKMASLNTRWLIVVSCGIHSEYASKKYSNKGDSKGDNGKFQRFHREYFNISILWVYRKRKSFQDGILSIDNCLDRINNYIIDILILNQHEWNTGNKWNHGRWVSSSTLSNIYPVMTCKSCAVRTISYARTKYYGCTMLWVSRNRFISWSTLEIECEILEWWDISWEESTKCASQWIDQILSSCSIWAVKGMSRAPDSSTLWSGIYRASQMVRWMIGQRFSLWLFHGRHIPSHLCGKTDRNRWASPYFTRENWRNIRACIPCNSITSDTIKPPHMMEVL